MRQVFVFQQKIRGSKCYVWADSYSQAYVKYKEWAKEHLKTTAAPYLVGGLPDHATPVLEEGDVEIQ
jgi:hypothetical protein